jgi:hypothetical protein
MTKFASVKYGGGKYGNANYITATTAGFKAAQADIMRSPNSLILINSHFKQYGNAVNYPSTCYIGGANHRRLAQSIVAPTSFTCVCTQIMI